MKRTLALIILAGTVFLTIPHNTYAASLYLTPSSGKIVVGQEFTVSVLTDTQGASINTAETNINFTSNTLELLDVLQGSTFLLPAPASPNKGISSAYFGGGLPNPGYTGKNGLLGTMKFRAKAVGQANITINRGNVLLNDGAGSQAVTSTAGASFIITPAAVGTVVVSSSTHPIQSSWTSRKDLDLSWTLPDKAVEVSYILDQNPTTIPDDVIDATSQNQTSYAGLKDGEWYFHIKAKSAGKSDPFSDTTHYKVLVDVTPPLPFSMNLVSETDAQNASETPTVNYKAVDATSGVYRYDIYLDGKLTQELSVPPYSFPKTEPGEHMIKVVAYDKAGNGTETELPLKVSGQGSAPVSFDYLRKYLQLPLYGLILLNLLIFLVVAVILRQNKKQQQQTAQHALQLQALRLEIRNTMDFEVDLSRLQRQIDVRFMDMARNQSGRLDDLRVDIGKKIQTEIERNVERLRNDISYKLTEAQSLGKKYYQQIRDELKENIADELRNFQQPVYARNPDTKVKTEVLRRLYDEFMNNKV